MSEVYLYSTSTQENELTSTIIVDDFDQGYPNCAALLNSDESFAIVRKFGRLNRRVLLHYEIKLTDMEKRLDELDRKDAADPKLKLRLGGYQVDGDAGEKDEMIAEIQKTLQEYSTFCSH